MIEQRITALKDDITSNKLHPEKIFEKHVIDLKTYFFNEFLKKPSDEYHSKGIIAKALGVHIHDVIFVGSAKLGYSLSPTKIFNPFDHVFLQTNQKKDKSDLDVAVISSRLFDDIAIESYEFTNAYSQKWFQNEYYSDNPNGTSIPLCYQYYEYISKGWFRPDMRPPNYEFCVSSTFEDLKGYFYRKYKRKLGLSIYKDWFYFKNYHINNLTNLNFKAKSNII